MRFLLIPFLALLITGFAYSHSYHSDELLNNNRNSDSTEFLKALHDDIVKNTKLALKEKEYTYLKYNIEIIKYFNIGNPFYYSMKRFFESKLERIAADGEPVLASILFEHFDIQNDSLRIFIGNAIYAQNHKPKVIEKIPEEEFLKLKQMEYAEIQNMMEDARVLGEDLRKNIESLTVEESAIYLSFQDFDHKYDTMGNGVISDFFTRYYTYEGKDLNEKSFIIDIYFWIPPGDNQYSYRIFYDFTYKGWIQTRNEWEYIDQDMQLKNYP